LSLRIPLTPDQTLQTEFHEIERRLRRLEKDVGVSAGTSTVIRVGGSGGSNRTVDLQPLLDRLDALEAAVTSLPPVVTYSDFRPVGSNSTRGLVPDPRTNEPPTGVSQHVLTEDNEWGYPLRGLIDVATAGEQTAPPYDVVDINAGIHAQSLSAGEIVCVDAYVYGTLTASFIIDGGSP
jgi:hypothetical protein